MKLTSATSLLPRSAHCIRSYRTRSESERATPAVAPIHVGSDPGSRGSWRYRGDTIIPTIFTGRGIQDALTQATDPSALS